jgi:hypothetical protein
MKAIGIFIKMQQQIRVFHWETSSYAEHKALGKAYENLDGLIDSFIETYIGKKGRPSSNITYNITLGSYKEGASIEILREYVSALTNTLPETLELSLENDTDLLTIRDEMLQLLNQTIYLLGLK